MKILAINGSPRKDGNTAVLLNRVLDTLKAKGFETELVQLCGEQIRGCRACGICKKLQNKKCVYAQDIFNEIFSKMLDADAIVVGSPTYFANMTSEIKAILDRAGIVNRANGGLLKGKVGAAVVAQRRAGADFTWLSMNTMFLMSGMFVPGASYMNIGFGSDKGAVAEDAEAMRSTYNAMVEILVTNNFNKEPSPASSSGQKS